MAHLDVDRMTDDESNLKDWPTLIRVLLFKECRFKDDRQLIFDSHSIRNGESAKISKNNNLDEFSHLKEMIFGSTVMKYHDTYYKIHDNLAPERLIFTHVFSTPNIKNRRISGGNINFHSGSSLLEYDLSSNCLSRSSMESNEDSFSIYRKNTSRISTNSTSSTIDSGFSESSFSVQSSRSSFTRSANLASTNSIYELFANGTDSTVGMSGNPSRSRLGVALILPVKSESIRRENIYIHLSSFVEFILWRIRHYVELAVISTKLFLPTMYEISSMSAKWLSRELQFRSQHREEEAGKASGIFSVFNRRLNSFFRRKSEEDLRFERFLKTVKELDVKETKFFLSSLLTAVLTHHTGWIESCYPTRQQNGSNSYHAVWRQLLALHGATEWHSVTSKTVIYGTRNDQILKNAIDFLRYFVRYPLVKKRCVTNENLSEEDEIVAQICNNSVFREDGENKEGIKSTSNDVKINNNNNNSNRGLLRKVKTFGRALNEVINDEDDGINVDEGNRMENPVLFILGDSDKLENLKTHDTSDKNANLSIVKTLKNKSEDFDEAMKLNILKFPLPKYKPVGEFSEIVPREFFPENGFSDIYIPERVIQATNCPEENWKNLFRNDLSRKSTFLFPNQLDENIGILANIDNWEVQILSSNRNKSDSLVVASPLVSNILDTISQMSQSNVNKEHCTRFIEQSLLEICLKGNALSQLLLTVDFCTVEFLLNALKVSIADIPLLMSVASRINPEILTKYGLTYQ
ncbi:unnamed protein product [Phyllotreta striolata]|uniref:UDENN FNIP1/2-type domain-containing protein n=1 Tax=Phyllotreta striolata TaxID=444603 RepID=A0A9N9TK22_PHYSR|nr:unnamed protein product [Phyllotreta striolata]